MTIRCKRLRTKLHLSFSSLPDDIIHYICSWLFVREHVQLSQTSQGLYVSTNRAVAWDVIAFRPKHPRHNSVWISFVRTFTQHVVLYNIQRHDVSFLTSILGLQRITLGGTHIITLNAISACSQLRHLELKRCPKLQTLNGIEHLTHLESLRIEDCDALFDIASLSRCKILRDLCLIGLNVSVIPSLRKCANTLKGLRIKYCPNLIRVQNLGALVYLQTLNLVGCPTYEIRSLKAVQQLYGLKVLNLSDMCVTHLNIISPQAPLVSLNLSLCDRLHELPTQGLKHVRTLDVSHCIRLYNFQPLADCTKIRSLNVSYTKFDNIGLLQECTQLHTLHINGCSYIQSFAHVIKLPHLQSINVDEYTEMCDVSPLVNWIMQRPKSH